MTERSLTVCDITRTVIRLPFRDPIERHMHRQLPHWPYFEVCEVKLADGTSGVGETMLHYTWEQVEDEDIERALGSNAANLLWSDSLGAGLQMALFDAVGKSLGVPVHALLGEQVRETVALAWWAIDMPPADLAAEAERAFEQGYTRLKFKARPWFDIYEQLETIERRLPSSFRVGLDFNKTFPDAETALPILTNLQSYSNVEAFEEPILQKQYAGNRRLREELDVALAHHYGYEPPWEALTERIADGYVLTGGASTVSDQAAICHEAGLPLWLQLVGTEITTAFCIHLGAVSKTSTWPAVTCHQLYADSVLSSSLPVEDGETPVSNTPGLGIELDRSKLEQYATDRPEQRPEPPRLLKVTWANGRNEYFASGHQLRSYAQDGNVPLYERGVETRLVPDDGSDEWQSLHERVIEEPVKDI